MLIGQGGEAWGKQKGQFRPVHGPPQNSGTIPAWRRRVNF